MELSRTRPKVSWIICFLLAGLVLIWASQNGWELRLVFIPVGSVALLVVGLLMIVGTLAAVANGRRPAPIAIDESGLRLRVAGINRSVPWSAVHAVVLEPYPLGNRLGERLVLVPAEGADLGVALKHTVDDRPAVILLSRDSLRIPREQLIEVFGRYGGERFVQRPAGTGLGRAPTP